MKVAEIHEIIWEPYRLFYSLGDNELTLVGEFCCENRPKGYLDLSVSAVGTREEDGFLYVVCSDD